jgi:arginyl-tRNA synthetase
MIWDELRGWLDSALQEWAKSKSLATLPDYSLEEPPAEIDADAACNLAMLLAKPLRQSPKAIAQDLQKALSATPNELIDAITIAGAGFVNFRFSDAALRRELAEVLSSGERYGRLSKPAGDKVLIEFVSANPTGPLHVGHGRGAALGDSLALILAHLGYPVSREYYINDAGNQVQMLGESVRARCLELEGKTFSLPEQGYHGDYVKEIAQEYLKAHPGDVDDYQKLIPFSLRRMQQAIAKDLEAFGVRFDSWFSEHSVVQKGLVDKHVNALKDRGYIQTYEDAVWFVAPGEEGVEKDKDRVLKRKDGRWTYFATDIAYHADKFERGFTRLIDIWGADHHGYVPRVKGSLQALGYDASRLHILLYQLVSLSRGGVPVSMSKRSGDFITLREVLEEVGKDACRFFFALRGPNTAMEFDLELAKKHTDENPVYYLQYAHARICSIFKNAGVASLNKENLLPHPASSVPNDVDLSLLKEPQERALMKRMAQFPNVLQACAALDSPHPLAGYLLLLGRQFHFFYDHVRVLVEDPATTRSRLALLTAVRQVLRLGLSLLGVSAPEAM